MTTGHNEDPQIVLQNGIGTVELLYSCAVIHAISIYTVTQ